MNYISLGISSFWVQHPNFFLEYNLIFLIAIISFSYDSSNCQTMLQTYRDASFISSIKHSSPQAFFFSLFLCWILYEYTYILSFLLNYLTFLWFPCQYQIVFLILLRTCTTVVPKPYSQISSSSIHSKKGLVQSRTCNWFLQFKY